MPSLLRSGITKRELEVLQLLARRLSNREIAERLVVSVRTVESHVSSLLAKLHVDNRRALASLAPGLVAGGTEVPVALRFSAARSPLVGRRVELDGLVALWQQVTVRRRRTVAVVRGPAGVGKTRLAAELAGHAISEGRVWYGHCDRDDQRPYRPFVEANDAIANALSSVTSEGERYQAFDSACGIVSHSAPLLLVIDDLQWADQGTVLLLRDLTMRPDPLPLLVAATCRDDEPPPAPVLGLLVDLRRAAALEECSLGGLPDGDARHLVHHGLGDADADVVGAVVDRAAGNPFVVHQFIEHIRKGGSPRDIPSGVRELVAHRLKGLGGETAALVRLAAVAGHRSTATVLAHASGLHHEAVVESMGPAVAARLVADIGHGRYEFTHDLLRETIYEQLSDTPRQRLHARVADALEAYVEEAWPEITRHRWAAGTPSPEAAARAASFFAARLAYSDAAQHFAMAAEATSADQHLERGRLLQAEGDCRRRAGDAAGALRCYEEARQAALRAGDRELVVDAALGTAAAKPLYALDAELVQLLEDVLAVAVDDARRARVLSALAQARYYTSSIAEREQLTSEAVTLARRSGDHRTIGEVLVARRAALWGDPDALSERIKAASDVVDFAGSAADQELAVKGHSWLVVDLLELGDIDGFQRARESHAALAGGLRQPLHLCDVLTWRAAWATAAGEEADARAAIEGIHALAQQTGDTSASAAAIFQTAWLASLAGETARVAETIPVLTEIALARSHVPALQIGFAAFVMRAGDGRSARAILDRNLLQGVKGVPRDANWLLAMSELAELAVGFADGDLARDLIAVLQPYEARFVVVDRALACKGVVAHDLGLLHGLLGNRAQALRYLEAAAAVHEAIGAAALAARSRAALADVAASSGVPVRGDGAAPVSVVSTDDP